MKFELSNKRVLALAGHVSVRELATARNAPGYTLNSFNWHQDVFQFVAIDKIVEQLSSNQGINIGNVTLLDQGFSGIEGWTPTATVPFKFDATHVNATGTQPFRTELLDNVLNPLKNYLQFLADLSKTKEPESETEQKKNHEQRKAQLEVMGKELSAVIAYLETKNNVLNDAEGPVHCLFLQRYLGNFIGKDCADTIRKLKEIRESLELENNMADRAIKFDISTDDVEKLILEYEYNNLEKKATRKITGAAGAAKLDVAQKAGKVSADVETVCTVTDQDWLANNAPAWKTSSETAKKDHASKAKSIGEHNKRTLGYMYVMVGNAQDMKTSKFFYDDSGALMSSLGNRSIAANIQEKEKRQLLKSFNEELSGGKDTSEDSRKTEEFAANEIMNLRATFEELIEETGKITAQNQINEKNYDPNNFKAAMETLEKAWAVKRRAEHYRALLARLSDYAVLNPALLSKMIENLNEGLGALINNLQNKLGKNCFNPKVWLIENYKRLEKIASESVSTIKLDGVQNLEPLGLNILATITDEQIAVAIKEIEERLKKFGKDAYLYPQHALYAEFQKKWKLGDDNDINRAQLSSIDEIKKRHEQLNAALLNLRSIQTARASAGAQAEQATILKRDKIVKGYDELTKLAKALNEKVIPGGVNPDGTIDAEKFQEFCKNAKLEDIIKAMGPLVDCLRKAGKIDGQFPVQTVRLGELNTEYDSLDVKYKTPALNDARGNATNAIDLGTRNAQYALAILRKLKNIKEVEVDAQTATQEQIKPPDIQKIRKLHTDLGEKLNDNKPGGDYPPVPNPPAPPGGGAGMSDSGGGLPLPQMLPPVPPRISPHLPLVLPWDNANGALSALGLKIAQLDKILEQEKKFKEEFDAILKDTEAARKPLMDGGRNAGVEGRAQINLLTIVPKPTYEKDDERAKNAAEMEILSDQVLSKETGFVLQGADALGKYEQLYARAVTLSRKLKSEAYQDYAKTDVNVATRVKLLTKLINDSEIIAEAVKVTAENELGARTTLVTQIQTRGAAVDAAYQQLKGKGYLNVDVNELKRLPPDELTSRLKALNIEIELCSLARQECDERLRERPHSEMVDGAHKANTKTIDKEKTEEENARNAILAALTAQAELITTTANETAQAIILPTPPGPPGKRKQTLQDAATALKQLQEDLGDLPDPNKPPFIPNDPYIPAHGSARDAVSRLKKAIDDANKNDAEQENEFTLNLEDYLKQAKDIYDKAGEKNQDEIHHLSDTHLESNSNGLASGIARENTLNEMLDMLVVFYPTVTDVEARVAEAKRVVGSYINGVAMQQGYKVGLNEAESNTNTEDALRRGIVNEVRVKRGSADANFGSRGVQDAIAHADEVEKTAILLVQDKQQFEQASQRLATSIQSLRDALVISYKAIDDVDATDLKGLPDNGIRAVDDHKNATIEMAQINKQEKNALDKLLKVLTQLVENGIEQLDPSNPNPPPMENIPGLLSAAKQIISIVPIPGRRDPNPYPGLVSAVGALEIAIKANADELIRKHNVIERNAYELIEHVIGGAPIIDGQATLVNAEYEKHYNNLEINQINDAITTLVDTLDEKTVKSSFESQSVALNDLGPLCDKIMPSLEEADRISLQEARASAQATVGLGVQNVYTALGILYDLRARKTLEQAQQQQRAFDFNNQLNDLQQKIAALLERARVAYIPVSVISARAEYRSQSDDTLIDDDSRSRPALREEYQILSELEALKNQYPLIDAKTVNGLVDNAVETVEVQYVVNITPVIDTVVAEQAKRLRIIDELKTGRVEPFELPNTVRDAIGFSKEVNAAGVVAHHNPPAEGIIRFANGAEVEQATLEKHVTDLRAALVKSAKAMEFVNGVYRASEMHFMQGVPGIEALKVHDETWEQLGNNHDLMQKALDNIINAVRATIVNATDNLDDDTRDPRQKIIDLNDAVALHQALDPLVNPGPRPKPNIDPPLLILHDELSRLAEAIDGKKNDLIEKYQDLEATAQVLNEHVIPEALRETHGDQKGALVADEAAIAEFVKSLDAKQLAFEIIKTDRALAEDDKTSSRVANYHEQMKEFSNQLEPAYQALSEDAKKEVKPFRKAANNAIELGGANATSYRNALRNELERRNDAKSKATDAADKMRRAILAADNFLKPKDPTYIPDPRDIKPQSELFGSAVDEYRRAMDELKKDPSADPILPPGEEDHINTNIARVTDEFELADLRAQFMAEIAKILKKAKESDDRVLALGVLTDRADRDSIVDMKDKNDDQITTLMREASAATAQFESRIDELTDLLSDRRFARLNMKFKDAQVQIAHEKIVPYMQLSTNVEERSFDEDEYRNAMVKEVSRVFYEAVTNHWEPDIIQNAIVASNGQLADLDQMALDEIQLHIEALDRGIVGIRGGADKILAINPHASSRVEERRNGLWTDVKEKLNTEIVARDRLKNAYLARLSNNERIIKSAEWALAELNNLNIQPYDPKQYSYNWLTREGYKTLTAQRDAIRALKQLAQNLLIQNASYPENVRVKVSELNEKLREAIAIHNDNGNKHELEIPSREAQRLNDTFRAKYRAANAIDKTVQTPSIPPLNFSENDHVLIVQQTETVNKVVDKVLTDAAFKIDEITTDVGHEVETESTFSSVSTDSSVSDHSLIKRIKDFENMDESEKAYAIASLHLDDIQLQLESARQVLVDELNNKPQATRGGDYLPGHWKENGILSDNDHAEMIGEYIDRIDELLNLILRKKHDLSDELISDISEAAHAFDPDEDEDDLDLIPYLTLEEMLGARKSAIFRLENMYQSFLNGGISAQSLDRFYSNLMLERDAITAEMYRREIRRDNVSLASFFFVSKFMQRKNPSDEVGQFLRDVPVDRDDYFDVVIEQTDDNYQSALRAISDIEGELDAFDDAADNAIERLQTIIDNAEASLGELEHALNYEEAGKVQGYLRRLLKNDLDNRLSHDIIIEDLKGKIAKLQLRAEEKLAEIELVRNPPRDGALDDWIEQLLDAARSIHNAHNTMLSETDFSNDGSLIAAYQSINLDFSFHPTDTTAELNVSRNEDELQFCGLLQIQELLGLALKDLDRDDLQQQALPEVQAFIQALEQDRQRILQVMEQNLIQRHISEPAAHNSRLNARYYTQNYDNLDEAGLQQILNEFDYYAGIQNPGDPNQISTSFMRDTHYLNNLNNSNYPLELIQLNQQLNSELLGFHQNAVDFRNGLKARLDQLLNPPYKPTDVDIIVPPAAKQQLQANNIQKLIDAGGKPAREIHRLNIDALLYLYTKLEQKDRDWVYQQLAGQQGHVHIQVKGVGTFSLMLPEPLDARGTLDDDLILNTLVKSAGEYLDSKRASPGYQKQGPKEFGSHQRYENLLNDLSQGKILPKAPAGSPAQDTAVQEQIREALFKRTSALKQERYVLDVIDKSDPDTFDTPEFLEDEMKNAIDAFWSNPDVQQKHKDELQKNFIFKDVEQLILDELATRKIPSNDPQAKTVVAEMCNRQVREWNKAEPLVLKQTDGGGNVVNFLITARMVMSGTGPTIQYYSREITEKEANDLNALTTAQAWAPKDVLLSDPLPIAITAKGQHVVVNLVTKKEVAHAKEHVAVLEHKKDVLYGADPNGPREDVFKLTMKGVGKTEYLDAWDDADALIVDMVENGVPKQYLVTAKTFAHKASGKDRVGYYLKDVTGKTQLQIDTMRDYAATDKPISDADIKNYKPKSGEDLSARIKEHIATEVVNKQLGAPCIKKESTIGVEPEYARGSKTRPH